MAGPPAPEPEGEPGEFEQIARLYRPLTQGSPEALGLLDDVAVLTPRPGQDVVLTADAMVEGVHFLPGEALDLVARKLLRANLSDMAAKGAEPHGYLLTVAWPPGVGFSARQRFAEGLALDQAAFGVRLLGGDTVSTTGPLTASLTLLGWSPSGTLTPRGGAAPGHVVLVSGTIGDAGLGLLSLTDGLPGLSTAEQAWLVARHRLPTPRLALRTALRAHACAAADVSDGLLADAGHIGEASGFGVHIDLDLMPVSPAALSWLRGQPDEAAARLRLATAGDDYEVVCTAPPEAAESLIEAARAGGTPMTRVGEVRAAPGVTASFSGEMLQVERRGWTHR